MTTTAKPTAITLTKQETSAPTTPKTVRSEVGKALEAIRIFKKTLQMKEDKLMIPGQEWQLTALAKQILRSLTGKGQLDDEDFGHPVRYMLMMTETVQTYTREVILGGDNHFDQRIKVPKWAYAKGDYSLKKLNVLLEALRQLIIAIAPMRGGFTGGKEGSKFEITIYNEMTGRYAGGLRCMIDGVRRPTPSKKTKNAAEEQRDM